MIIDKIENAYLYSGLSKRLTQGFNYLKNTDLLNSPLGTFEIDGKDVFAIVQEYKTKPQEECIIEAHYKYIDIQFIIQGQESIGVTHLTNQTPYEVNKENDYAFYKTKTALVPLSAGMFAVFYPSDIHQPCIAVGSPEKVKKVVVKVRLD
ncbi:MAG: YhcH/YjgK/YiaL family protein [Bacteroidia bacterium]|nr:YhcH/YjgK/YiaL family protein [Bacteroidia bacterium]